MILCEPLCHWCLCGKKRLVGADSIMEIVQLSIASVFTFWYCIILNSLLPLYVQCLKKYATLSFINTVKSLQIFTLYPFLAERPSSNNL